jgi:hypothetical protein
MADKHASQTGRREMFSSGDPQMRQSDGNTVVKRAATTSYNPEVNRSLTPAFSSSPLPELLPLLLKTTLPRSAVAAEAPAERIFSSIAVPDHTAQLPRRYRK